MGQERQIIGWKRDGTPIYGPPMSAPNAHFERLLQQPNVTVRELFSDAWVPAPITVDLSRLGQMTPPADPSQIDVAALQAANDERDPLTMHVSDSDNPSVGMSADNLLKKWTNAGPLGVVRALRDMKKAWDNASGLQGQEDRDVLYRSLKDFLAAGSMTALGVAGPAAAASGVGVRIAAGLAAAPVISQAARKLTGTFRGSEAAQDFAGELGYLFDPLHVGSIAKAGLVGLGSLRKIGGRGVAAANAKLAAGLALRGTADTKFDTLRTTIGEERFGQFLYNWNEAWVDPDTGRLMTTLSDRFSERGHESIVPVSKQHFLDWVVNKDGWKVGPGDEELIRQFNPDDLAEIRQVREKARRLLLGDSGAATGAGLAGSPKDVGKLGTEVAAANAKLAAGRVAFADATADVILRDAEELLPSLSKSRHGGTVKAGQYVGAPTGVNSPQKFAAMVKDYLRAMEEGIQGRQWYRETSADLLSRSAGDTAQADLMADNLAILSPANSVGGNANMSRNSHIQAMTGDPIVSARFPDTQIPALEKLYNEMRSYIGLKRDPFSRQMSVAWAPERVGRGVNDMHEARLMGYPENQTISETNHAFMDKVRASAIKIANQRKLGSFSDWDTGSSQASAWVGSKIRQGQIEPGAGGKHFGDYLSRFEGNATYESTPGSETGHLSKLLDASYNERLRFDQDPRGRWETPYGNDSLYAAQGMLPGQTVQTVGRYRDEINPANVATPLLSSSAREGDIPGALFPGSRRALEATEAFRAYMDAQHMGASNTGKLLEGTGPSVTGVVLDLDGPLDAEVMRKVADALEPKGYWLASDRGGGISILGNAATVMGKELAKDVRMALKAAGVPTVGKLTPVPIEKFSTDYTPNWKQGSGAVTLQMLETLEKSPATMAALEKDPRVSAILFGKNTRDVEFASTYGVARKEMLEARKVFASAPPGSRFQALYDAAKKGIVPAFLLGAILQESQQTK